MNIQIIAVLISEGAKLAGQWFRNRPILLKSAPIPALAITERAQLDDQPLPGEATEVATGCIPCAIGHFGTCSGLLNEAVRFSKSDGMKSNEVIDRVGGCLDELNTMERVDLRPEMIVSLPEWERELANEVLVISRTTRHTLEDFESVESLEKAAAQTQVLRTQIWRKWIKGKLKNPTPEEEARIRERVIEHLDKLLVEEEEVEE